MSPEIGIREPQLNEHEQKFVDMVVEDMEKWKEEGIASLTFKAEDADDLNSVNIRKVTRTLRSQGFHLSTSYVFGKERTTQIMEIVPAIPW